MHGTSSDRRALEREALRNVINQWNANRLDLFELSEPNEDLEFHGVMRFYFQDAGQKVATKCIRVASDATVEDVIGTLVEKFRPDMRMLSVPSYALYELHEGCPERRMSPDEKPLLVQLNWHVDDREGRFLLKNIDDKTVNAVCTLDTRNNVSFRRKLSKREKKQLKKQEKLSRMKSENGGGGGGGLGGGGTGQDENDDGVAEKLYHELPETSFTRSISNPEAVMRRRRQQKLEQKLQQFRSKDGGPDTGGTLKIYGEALCKDVPYKTLLLSVRDCAGAVVREMLDKYGLNKTDPSQWCLVQVTQQPGQPDVEYVLDDDECPLSILMTSPNTGSIMFHVRRRPADCAPRKRKKKPGVLGTNATNPREGRQDAAVPFLVELGPDGSVPHLADTSKVIRLTGDVMEVGSSNGIALQLYGPHIQPSHCVITTADGVTSLTPCHADAHTYINGQRIHQTTILQHGALIKFGHSNAYRFFDPGQEDRIRIGGGGGGGTAADSRLYDSRSPRALSPTEVSRDNIETTFDLEGNVETVSTASGAREDSRSLGSTSENRLSGMDRYPRGQDPILPAVLEFPEEPQEQFLARVITHLDVTTPTFRLAPAYTLYLCARYRASTHYRPELTPTERAHKLTVLLQHAAMLIRHTIQDRSTEVTSQAFWLANSSELLHFLKSDRHVSAFSLQAQDTLADGVQLSFKNLLACLTDELNTAMLQLMAMTDDEHPRDVIGVLSGAMNLLRKCRVNAALTIQLFSQLFHWISAKALAHVITNPALCTRAFGGRLGARLRNLQAWSETQGLELAAECHLAKIVQCCHLLQAPKYSPEDLANLSSACFKLNSMQLGTLLRQYKPEMGEKLAPPSLLDQAAKAAESVADELARAEGRDVTLYEDPAPPTQLLLPDDGFSCDIVQGVPAGLADFLHPLQASGLCRLAAQPTSSGHWTVYMSPAPRPPSAMSGTQPEVQMIRLHKAGGGMGLSIVAAKGAGQERLGIYIKSVVPGGAADRDGRLAAGDQLLAVDGQSLLGITQEKAAEFLVRTGSVVTLEVAKGGAVYHGLATLLQQPSPTPHRASGYAESVTSSQESLYSLNDQPHHRIFTPPPSRPKNQVFFSSDDTLYKRDCLRKFTIPRIEIETDAPVFNLQVTDFSEPLPKNMILTYDESGTSFQTKPVDVPADHSAIRRNFVQQKSYSIDTDANPHVNVDNITETDKFLSIGVKKYRQQRNMCCSSSLQDLSSSTSSVNSGVHESNLDLSSMDPDTPIKHRQLRGDLLQFDSKNMSFPELNGRKNGKQCHNSKMSVSDENLEDKLTEYERVELLKLLRDWSLNGSEAKSTFDMTLMKRLQLKTSVSEPNLSGKNGAVQLSKALKYTISDNNLNEDDFGHKCEYRNCIFNRDYNTTSAGNKPIKGILKHSRGEQLSSMSNLQKTPILINNTDNNNSKAAAFRRRFSEMILDTRQQQLNSQLVRCDSLERMTTKKKFPDAYIVRKNGINAATATTTNYKHRCNRNNNNNNDDNDTKKCVPKTWKSCSDIKHHRQSTTIRKCCRFAKKNCPILTTECKRKSKSCVNIVLEADESQQNQQNTSRLFHCPRRMSERDLPSRVDSEQQQHQQRTTIPSSKSVPALHHIAPLMNNSNNELPPLHQHHHQQQQQIPTRNTNSNQHDVFNPGYSRTSSNNSINQTTLANNNIGNNGNPAAMRSRSTHNLYQQQQQQQQDGFYQNLSVYRNKIPSPQHLGDRTSALRSSQNSLQSTTTSTTAAQRPSSAYYPPQLSTNVVPRLNLHQSIPNLKSPVGHHRLQNDSYPTISNNSSYHHTNTPPYQQQQNYSTSNISAQQQQNYSSNTSYPSPVHSSTPNYPQNGSLVDFNRQYEMRSSKSEDMLKYPSQNDMMRYASSGNIRSLESSKVEIPLYRMKDEDLVRKQRPNYQTHQPNYPQQQQQQYYNAQMAHNMQNLTLNNNHHHQYYQNQYYSGNPQGPQSPKSPPVAPKPKHHFPEPPPVTTHPLYAASSQDLPKMAFYQTASGGGNVTKTPRDPWLREEQEKQEQARREASRQWQEHQIRELMALPHRTQQQEEQLRVLQLEREFQRRAMEAAEQDDDDTEKESPSPSMPQTPKVETPTSILKPGGLLSTIVQQQQQQQHHHQQQQQLQMAAAAAASANLVAQQNLAEQQVAVPAPPERGSSFAVMSMRVKDQGNTKRVSFDTSSPAAQVQQMQMVQQQQQQQPPNTLQLEESVREDPNSFIRQAESMLASPTTPTDGAAALMTATPGVIGAQEVYRDPRARRLAEQAQQKQTAVPAVPEKLSFKEKMKMFAMETGEQETPKDKSKISRAQREIDNIGSPPSSGMVH